MGFQTIDEAKAEMPLVFELLGSLRTDIAKAERNAYEAIQQLDDPSVLWDDPRELSRRKADIWDRMRMQTHDMRRHAESIESQIALLMFDAQPKMIVKTTP